jgi:hypothetical protein
MRDELLHVRVRACVRACLMIVCVHGTVFIRGAAR